MRDLTVACEVLNPEREVIFAEAAQRWPVPALDTVVNRSCQASGLAEKKYVILLLKLKSGVLGPEPIVIEKAFPAGGDRVVPRRVGFDQGVAVRVFSRIVQQDVACPVRHA